MESLCELDDVVEPPREVDAPAHTPVDYEVQALRRIEAHDVAKADPHRAAEAVPVLDAVLGKGQSLEPNLRSPVKHDQQRCESHHRDAGYPDRKQRQRKQGD